MNAAHKNSLFWLTTALINFIGCIAWISLYIHEQETYKIFLSAICGVTGLMCWNSLRKTLRKEDE